MKILSIDIETAPKRAFVWGMWKQNIGTNQLIDDWFMLTWSAKWLGEDDIIGERLTVSEVTAQDDSRLLASLWPLLDEADVIIAHNGDRFDIPSINTRFIANGIMPPSPYKSIDTLKVAKRKFKFSSNRLDYLGEFLGCGRKLDTGGFELWEQCLLGSEEHLDKMLEYNMQDVQLLEDVYLLLRPFIPAHPNHNIFTEDHCCPSCGSDNVHKRGFYTTNVSKFQRYRCNDCGSWSRARTNVRTKDEMKNTLIGVH